MFRFLAGTAALAAAIPSGGYDKGHDTGYGKHDDGYGKSYDKHDDGYGKSSGHYGKRHHSKRHSDVHFPKAYAIIDPDYYNTVFTGYQACVANKCDSLPNAYSSAGLSDCISTVAGYTSCVTACAAAQTFETVENFRTLLDDVLVIGHDQLRKARLYLSGLGDLDVVGERIHIGDSCCLPNSYFAAWERILVPVEIPDLKVDDDSSDGYKKHKKHKKHKKDGYKKKKRSSKGKYRVLAEGDDGDATADDKQVDEYTEPEEHHDDDVVVEHHDDDKDDDTYDDKGDDTYDDKDDNDKDDDDKDDEDSDDNDDEASDDKDAKYDDKKETKYDDKKDAKVEDKKDAKYDDTKETQYDNKKGDEYDDKPARVHDEGKADTPSAKYMISAADYVKQCLPCESKTNKVEWLNHIKCDTKLAEYLQFLQRNLGHLILAPTCKDLAPDGACCGDDVKQYNPRAVKFHDDVCVATKSEKNGKHKSLTNALVKPVDHDNYRDPCPCDTLDHEGSHATIRYKRIKRRNLKYYSVATGLPSAVSVTDHVASCEYDFGLVRDDDDDSASSYGDDSFFRPAPAPANWDAALEAVRACPTDGLLEYCNVDQYASYLEYQLFDHASCDVSELRLQDTDKPASYKTIACLYKIFTLKCDCMEAVLNCYVLTPKFATALSKVIGQAASVLCGFILCQRPSVYALFGEQYAVSHATLFRELLAAAGVLDGAATTPAMTVFASFALGMVALVVAKKVRAAHDAKTIDVDEGYQNLI